MSIEKYILSTARRILILNKSARCCYVSLRNADELYDGARPAAESSGAVQKYVRGAKDRSGQQGEHDQG